VASSGCTGFSRYWQAAATLDKGIAARLRERPDGISAGEAARALQHVFVEQSILAEGRRFHARQVAAVALALRARFLVLSGGPGTGKTSVVIQILRALLHAHPGLQPDRVALCAPTGRAKARLGESLDSGLDALERRYGTDSVPARERALRGCHRRTLHSLLGMRPDGSFRNHGRDPLPYQVIVVDEASMVDLCLCAGLMDAASPTCRIVLVGDMHQLPSVEAGAVLGDLTERFAESGMGGYPSCRAECAGWIAQAAGAVPVDSDGTADSLVLSTETAVAKAGTLADHAVVLTHSYRSTREILELSERVNRGDADSALASLGGRSSADAVSLDESAGMEPIRRWLAGHYTADRISRLGQLQGVEPAGEGLRVAAAEAQALLAESCVLTLAHEGGRGRIAINTRAEGLLRQRLDPSSTSRFFHGQPVILGTNHHDLDLYNGDIGMVLRVADGGLRVVFPRSAGSSVQAVERLSGLEPAFAMTVHKAQGSEFTRVLLVLPERESPLANRQILYTAVTRAREQVRILGGGELLRRAISARGLRPGGVTVA
jgi:exodeoxyribonuclease V alpha subunit